MKTPDGMLNYVVLHREVGAGPLDPPQGFQCWAEDSDHAEEQCENAYPDNEILWVWQGEFGVGVDPAIQDWLNAGD